MPLRTELTFEDNLRADSRVLYQFLKEAHALLSGYSMKRTTTEGWG